MRHLDGPEDGRADGRTDARTHGQTDGRVGGRADGTQPPLTDGRTDGLLRPDIYAPPSQRTAVRSAQMVLQAFVDRCTGRSFATDVARCICVLVVFVYMFVVNMLYLFL